MRAFTDSRTDQTEDELWVLEHHPVYTLGQAGKVSHILNAQQIPVVQSDRGGQVTYHGPGQVIVYTLVNLRRAGLGVRGLVQALENAVIETLAGEGVTAEARRDAPGVYVNNKKIAALGLRVRKGCSYHGLSLNIDPDLTPFKGINPCGYAGMEVTSTCELGIHTPNEQIVDSLLQAMQVQLSGPN